MFKKIIASLIFITIFFANPVFAEKITVTEKLWILNQSAYSAILKTPFIQQMLDNTLSEASMKAFMAQDTQYLLDYEKAIHLIALKFPAYHPMRMFFLQYEKDTQMEREFLLKTFLKDSTVTTQKTDVTTAYTHHLLTTAEKGNLAEAVAAILPCAIYFKQLGLYLQENVKDVDNHRFGAWIKRYADAGDGSTESVEAIADYLSEEHPDMFAAMQEKFSRSAEYELKFFQYNAL